MGKPIYVEIAIRAPLGELWRLTQSPDLHQRWDLRFTRIAYLPRPDPGKPQRFLYETRIGFGLGVSGEGESVGERDLADGTRSSALRFWSADPRSLIAEGSGYWKYVPDGASIRFLTRYDDVPRFGLPGPWLRHRGGGDEPDVGATLRLPRLVHRGVAGVPPRGGAPSCPPRGGGAA